MLFVPREEKGQGVVEYAFLLILVGLATMVIFILLGPGVANSFSNIINAI